ncbi:14 kDa phosphohistidine phosphatase-like [Battus philenor]|uniref:14 kDa phosphohistidine phosphatase-like n=1 Tax=Battus philenor TaxID=42288 RepID=UPI0035D0C448
MVAVLGGFRLNCKNFVSIINSRILYSAKASNHCPRKMSSLTELSNIPKVDIDKSGVFKYILIKVYNKDKQEESPVTIVRGYAHCNYHSDILDEVQDKLKPLECEVLGGGRISHDADFKRIKIYGYSQGFGKADHEVTANIVKDVFPNYTITISDEGY